MFYLLATTEGLIPNFLTEVLLTDGSNRFQNVKK